MISPWGGIDTKIDFNVPGQPQGKARARTVRDGAGHVRSYTPAKTKQYETLIAWAYKGAGGKMFPDGAAVNIEIEARYQIPKSYTKKKASACAAGDVLPLVKPDVDNISKAVLDALLGVAYRDDSSVVRVLTRKRYTARDEEPGCAVSVWSEDKMQ